MIIDLHFHTDKFSSCSKISFEEGIAVAKKRGLDAICLTEHDVIAQYPNIEDLEKKYEIKIFTGVEIYSKDGDILCYGLNSLPDEKISASDLTSYVKSCGGATIAAHPFRKNDRGIKYMISELPDLDAVEAFNGNTSDDNNLKADTISKNKQIPTTGASDCHSLDKIGLYATQFEEKNILTVEDLARAIKTGKFQPVKYDLKEKKYTVL